MPGSVASGTPYISVGSVSACQGVTDLIETDILTLNLLTTTIVAPPSNASKWQMGFNSAFKGLNTHHHTKRTGVLKWTQ